MPYEMILRERYFPLILSILFAGCASSVCNAVDLGIGENEPPSLNQTWRRVAGSSSNVNL
jgi:hypothetical protein